MNKLDDYSGEFKPDIQPGDFSHNALEKMVRVYSKLYKAMDAYWYFAVMERSGNDEALACDIRAWEKLCLYEMEKVTQAFNITGKDVKALMKAFQILPWSWNVKWEFELINDNHAIWQVNDCPTVRAMELEDKGRENYLCNNIDMRLNKLYASYFNPDIKVIQLKAPPRQNKDDFFCRWEFKL